MQKIPERRFAFQKNEIPRTVNSLEFPAKHFLARNRHISMRRVAAISAEVFRLSHPARSQRSRRCTQVPREVHWDEEKNTDISGIYLVLSHSKLGILLRMLNHLLMAQV